MANYIVGLSGGIGSGKTTVSTLFEKLGVTIIDADIIARTLVAKGSNTLSQIIARFGTDFLTSNGDLDRAKLRTRIFSQPDDKLWLNNLLHPLIRTSILQALEQAPGDYCLLVAPLLLENKLEQLVDRILIVDVSEHTQIQRTLLRDGSNESEIREIINSQIARNLRQQAADDIINNENITLEKLEAEVALLHQSYIKMSSNTKK